MNQIIWAAKNKHSGNILHYYGLNGGDFDTFAYGNVVDFGLKIITLPNPLLGYFVFGGGKDVRPLFNSVGVETTILQPEEYSEDGAFYYVDGKEVNIYRGHPGRNFKTLSLKTAWKMVNSAFNFKEPIKEIKNEEEMEKEFNDMEEMSEGIVDSPIEKPKEHPLNNTVIESLNDEHGYNIIKWWQNQGVLTRKLIGNVRAYYGYKGYFDYFTENQVKINNLKIITLPNPLMNYCIKGTYDEVRPIYESIGIESDDYDYDNEFQYFFIEDNRLHSYIREKNIIFSIITPNQAKQMIEEFYSSESKTEVKEDKYIYPYLAKVWDDDYDDANIAIVVGKIEVGKPKYPILSVCDTDINLFINGEKYDHTWRKNAEPIGYDLESIRTRLDSIESEYKEIEESIQKMNEKRKSLKSEHSNLIEAKKLLELMNKAK